MSNPTLFILGRGDAPLKLLEAALDDQLTAAAFNPIDIEMWVLEGTEEPPALSDLAGYIEETYDGLEYQWRQNKDGSSLVTAFANRLAELEDIRRARVLVLWDESTATRQAVQAALDAKIEVYDLSDGLTTVGSLASEDTNDKEQSDSMPRSKSTTKASEPKSYTYDQLMDMDDETIIPICEAYGIDHESYPDWESVATLIVEKQGEAAGETEPEPETEPEVEEGDGYTRAQLEAMELDTLKEICRVNEIEVEGQRPRAGKYIEAIIEAQGGEPEGSEEEPTSDGDAGEGGTEDEQSYTSEDIVGVLSRLEADISVAAEASVAAGQAVQILAEGLDKGLKAIYDRLETVVAMAKELGDKIPAPEAVHPGTNGTATPAKAAGIKKVAGVKKLVKPSA